MKTALAFLTSEALHGFINPSDKSLWMNGSMFPLETLPLHLLDRASCETDDTYVQILPYVTIVDKMTKEVYAYQRGNGGTEERLHAKWSIGLGGHVDTMPATGIKLAAHLAQEAVRELNEEVGLEPTEALFQQLQSKFESKKFTVFYTRKDDVSKVHLGLNVIIEVDKADFGDVEKGCIDNGRWMARSDLRSDKLDFFDTLEPWSQMASASLTAEYGFDM